MATTHGIVILIGFVDDAGYSSLDVAVADGVAEVVVERMVLSLMCSASEMAALVCPTRGEKSSLSLFPFLVTLIAFPAAAGTVRCERDVDGPLGWRMHVITTGGALTVGGSGVLEDGVVLETVCVAPLLLAVLDAARPRREPGSGIRMMCPTWMSGNSPDGLCGLFSVGVDTDGGEGRLLFLPCSSLSPLMLLSIGVYREGGTTKLFGHRQTNGWGYFSRPQT